MIETCVAFYVEERKIRRPIRGIGNCIYLCIGALIPYALLSLSPAMGHRIWCK